jgi:nickel transport protein
VIARAVPLALLLLALPVGAHELQHEITTQEATVVSLRYADGTPFAYEAYEIGPRGAELPLQSGRSDAQGRIAFIAPETGRYTLRAWSEDGHGTVLDIDATPGAQRAGDGVTDRTLKILAGVGILFGVFGVLALFKRRT